MAETLVGRLGAAERWRPDLIRESGVDGRKTRSRVGRGGVHARPAPAQRRWVVWADAGELDRRRRRRRRSRLGAEHDPAGLTRPNPRPEAEPPDA
jgi:hypothetical protein